MKDLNLNLKEKTGFFKEIGSSVAGEMSKALQNLTGEKLEIEFISTQTFDEGRVSIDIEEKCFGSYVSFTSSNPIRGSLSKRMRGVVLAIFPLSSTRTLIELLLKRYLGKLDKEKIDYEMKLSAFKETANILVLTYITGLANALKVKLKMGVPKFVCSRNVEFIRSSLSSSCSNSDSLVSVGQFRITVESGFRESACAQEPCQTALLRPLSKGALLLFFSRTFKEENL